MHSTHFYSLLYQHQKYFTENPPKSTNALKRIDLQLTVPRADSTSHDSVCKIRDHLCYIKGQLTTCNTSGSPMLHWFADKFMIMSD